MRFRWIALGVAGFAVWLVATFGVVYAAIELAEDDAQAIVIWRSDDEVGIPSQEFRRYCVAYNLQGIITGELCKNIQGKGNDPPDCYLDAEVGKPLPSSCQFSD